MPHAIGLVVNPKLKSPLLVALPSAEGPGHDVDIYSLLAYEDEDDDMLEREGSGYYGGEDTASDVTGLPRVHTPGGVSQQGHGFGTALYTALCLGAALYAEGAAMFKTLLEMSTEGPGVSSKEGDRSHDAERWWSAAKRAGLAHEMNDQRSEEQEPDVRAADLRRCVEPEGPGKIVSVSRLVVEVEIDISADAYPFLKAQHQNLIVAGFAVSGLPYEVKAQPQHVRGRPSARSVDALWRRLRDSDNAVIEDVQLAPLLGLDVRGLRPESINLLMFLAAYGDATEEDLDGLRMRWQYGLDPAAPIPQMRLPFKKNSAEARAVVETLEHVTDIRSTLGWSDVENLP